MSLEQILEANTKAVQDMTAAILGGKSGAKAGVASAAAAKPAGKTKRSAEEVMAIAVKVKNDISKEAAQFLIKKHGSESLKALKPAMFEAFYADCETALEAGEVEGMDAEGDDI
jgi:electron transfer flavoprotein alpha/beta subunit